MFFVSDNQQERHNLIREFLTQDKAPIAVILAAIDFEWSVRRAILILGRRTTKAFHKHVLPALSGGIDGYKKTWKDEVAGHLGYSLPAVLPHWSRIVDKDKGAAGLRGSIVHGATGSVSMMRATQAVNDYLEASELLEKLVSACDRTLFRRVTRRKERTPAQLEALGLAAYSFFNSPARAAPGGSTRRPRH